MKTLIIPKPSIEITKELTTVSANVSIASKNYHLWYKIPFRTNVTETMAANALTCLLLFPAMKNYQALEIKTPISPKLLASLATIQNIFLAWHPEGELKRVHVIAKPSKNEKKRPKLRTATCFSGGVDSSYTLMKNKNEIKDLLYVHGFDIQLDQMNLRTLVSGSLANIAARMGKRLIQVETNIKQLAIDTAEWGEYTHGAALVSLAHLLASEINRLYIPSTHSYSDLFPWGSHVLLDNLWSSERLEFIHDGAEKTRFGKVEYIANDSFVLDNLTVCWQRLGIIEGERNCSHCEKCYRTMIALDALDKLDTQSSFAKKLDLKAVGNIDIKNENDLSFMMENYHSLSKSSVGNKSMLRSAVNESIIKYNKWKHQLDSGRATDIIAKDSIIRSGIIKQLWMHDTKSVLMGGLKYLPKKMLKLIRH